MKQKIFKELYFQTLKSQFKSLTEFQVIKEYMGQTFIIPDKSLIETDLVIEKQLALNPPQGKAINDIENAILVFETFSLLTPAEATDEKLWATLAHNDCWDYMRKRWPVEDNTAKNKAEYVEQRYFIKGVNTKNLLRHGIARLWWAVYLTKDENRENPYELTEEIFSMLDYTTHLMAGVQGRNRTFSKTVLSFVIDNKELFSKYKEKKVRFLLQKLNYMAGYKVFSALTAKEIFEILNNLKKDLLLVSD